jgi:alpha-tubulin suppressor-like RCC1 family protein|tara:strand:- start:345 stop:1046 length:702 start_codon:yes stop_codon:yes gene_type:complete
MTVMNQLMMGASGYGSDCPALEGTMWAWGDGNNYLGHGNLTQYNSPQQIGSGTDWTNNRSQFEHSATHHVIKANGTLWGWGENSYGQVGKGAGDHTTIKYESPVQIGSSTDWAQVSDGGVHAAAIKTDGTLWTWGGNFYGNLGHGDTTHRDEPTQVGSLTTWASVSCPLAYYTMAMKTDGTLWGCGTNRKGNLGDGTTTDRSSFVQAGSSTNWIAFSTAAGTNNGHVIALASS